MRHRLLRDSFGTLGSAEPAYPAEPIDEYRDLVMLAQTWERGSLEAEVVEEAPGRVDDAERKESPLR